MKTTKSFLRAIFCPLVLTYLLFSAPASAGLFSSTAGDAEELEQNRTALQLEIDALRRTQNVLFPLVKAATTLCGNDAAWSYSFRLAGRDRFKGDLKSAAPLLGYDKQVGVLYAANTSPAGQAGLRAGDAVVSIDGEKVFFCSQAFLLPKA